MISLKATCFAQNDVFCSKTFVFFGTRYSRLAGKLAGGDDGAAFPNADRALFQAINSNKGAAEQAKR